MENEIERQPDKMSSSIGKLAAALAEAQGEFEAITADRKGQMGHRTYKYADLSSFLVAALPILSKHGLAVVQRPLASEGSTVRLETLLTHKSGEWIGSELRIQAATDKDGNASAQTIGSAITYARRYSLAAMIGLAAEEDDDGKAAGKPGPRKATRVDASDPLCDELDRARIIRAAKDLEYDVAKVTAIIAAKKKTKLAELTKKEATSLAEALEKKFLSQQGKQTF